MQAIFDNPFGAFVLGCMLVLALRAAHLLSGPVMRRAVAAFWNLAARFLARPRVREWLWKRAERTPYVHITSADGKDVYMGRWWLFNPYDNEKRKTRYAWCPVSIRLHHIKRPDSDRHLHDHPWNARSIILAGGYVEQCEDGTKRIRQPGTTSTLKFGQFHRIERVARDGAWTLFITGRYRGSWGFLVEDTKVPYREYLAQRGQTIPAYHQVAGRAKRG